MNKLFLILMIFIFSSCSGSGQIYPDRRVIPANSFAYVEATLSITVCKEISGMSACIKDSFTSTGSGISLGQIGKSSLVLTAGHVCEIEENTMPKGVTEYEMTFKVFDRFGQSGVAKVINTSYAKPDICALLVPNMSIKGIKISRDAPLIGDRVYSLSAPIGIYHPPAVPVLEGIFSGDVPTKQFSMTTIRAIGGSSGSGIINMDGELVGILFATHPNFNSITLVSTYDLTIDFINQTIVKLYFME
jgi:S1-C subfamily serine protease